MWLVLSHEFTTVNGSALGFAYWRKSEASGGDGGLERGGLS